MISKPIRVLSFLLWLLLPVAAFGQVPYSLDISPGEVYQSPGSPTCATVSVAGGFYLVDVEYYFEYSGPYYSQIAVDGNGVGQICGDWLSPGLYEFTGVQNSYYPYGFTQVYASLYVYPPPPPPPTPPVIYGLGPGGNNWDSIWIGGTRFHTDSRVLVFAADWSAAQWFYGPDLNTSPILNYAPDTEHPENQWLSLQITDPGLLSAFGNIGVNVIVKNSDGTESGAEFTQSPRPVITSGVASCADFYCITLTGSFPLSADVGIRIHGQFDVIPNAFSGLSVGPNQITFQVNPSVRPAFDTQGLDVSVVNPVVANWSYPLYVGPVDRNITGDINGVYLSGLQYYVYGWACAKTFASSVDVYIYAGGPAGTGTWLGGATANLDSEPGVAAACNSTGSHYRFSVPIPHSITQNYGGQAIYVHGISPIGLPAYLLGHSGAYTVPSVDRSVTGFISGVVLENQQYYLRGWACAKTNPASIAVHLYAGGPAGSGTYVTSVTANQSSNPATTAVCNTGGTTYGFSILLTLALRQQFGGQTIFVHGISPFGLDNLLIGNSGNLTFPAPVATSSKEYIYIGDRLLAVDTTNLP